MAKAFFFLKAIKLYQCYFSKAVIPETNNLCKYKIELAFPLHLSEPNSKYNEGLQQCVKSEIQPNVES